MFKPPLDPPGRVPRRELTWYNVAVTYGMATVLIVAVGIHHLWNSTLSLVTVALLLVGGRRAYRLARRFADERMLTFKLGGTVEVRISQMPADEAN